MIDRIISQTQHRKSRLGCLGSCLVNLLMFSVLIIVGLLVIDMVIAPWVFYLGGRGFHIVPGWSGEGTLHTQAGNFFIYVTLNEPQYSRNGYPYLRGTGSLCTPNGQRFNTLNAYAYFVNKNIGRINTDNQPVNLEFDDYLHGWLNADYRPEFKISGSWSNGIFTGNDKGSLASAFLPDGNAYLGPQLNQPPAGKPVNAILTPGGWFDFKRACNSVH